MMPWYVWVWYAAVGVVVAAIGILTFADSHAWLTGAIWALVLGGTSLVASSFLLTRPLR